MSLEKTRFTLRLDTELKNTVQMMAEQMSSKTGETISSNDFIIDAIKYYVAYQNGQYDIPDILVQRINQLVDLQVMSNERLSALEDVMHSGVESLIKLSSGESYLNEE